MEQGLYLKQIIFPLFLIFFFFFTAETIRITWDKLRRCYINAINRRRNKREVQKKISHWKYEQEMSFLLPFINTRKTHEKIKEETFLENQNFEEIDYSQDQDCVSEKVFVESSEISSRPQTEELDPNIQQWDHINKRELSASSGSESDLKDNRVFNKYKKVEELDETDMFYLSMARMSKTLPLLEQAQIKLQLSNSVLQAQIKINQYQKEKGGQNSKN